MYGPQNKEKFFFFLFRKEKTKQTRKARIYTASYIDLDVAGASSFAVFVGLRARVRVYDVWQLVSLVYKLLKMCLKAMKCVLNFPACALA